MSTIDRRRVLASAGRAFHEADVRGRMRKQAPGLVRGYLRGVPGFEDGVRLPGSGECRISPGAVIRSGTPIYLAHDAVLTIGPGGGIGARSVVNVQRAVIICAGTQISPGNPARDIRHVSGWE